jgi:hypothetical protein
VIKISGSPLICTVVCAIAKYWISWHNIIDKIRQIFSWFDIDKEAHC